MPLNRAEDWWRRIRTSSDDVARGGHPVVFVVGAAVSYDRVNREGVPDVKGFIELIPREVEEEHHTTIQLRGGDDGEKYQHAFEDVRRLFSGGTDWMVRKGVLKACTRGETDLVRMRANSIDADVQLPACVELQKSAKDWVEPPAIGLLVDALAEAKNATKKRRELDKSIRDPTVVTTNFDGLIESALDRRGIACESVSLAEDDAAQVVPDHVNIWHVHGYWCQGPTHHTPYTMEYPRDRLKASLRQLFEGALVFVMGYGARHDVIFEVLKELVSEGKGWRAPDVHWALHAKDQGRAKRESPDVFALCNQTLAGRLAINLYLGVDVHCRHCEPAKVRCRNPRITLGSNTTLPRETAATNEMLGDFSNRSKIPTLQIPHDHEPLKAVFASEYLKMRPHDVVAWLAGQSVGRGVIQDIVASLPDDVREGVKRARQPWINMRKEEESFVVPFKTYPWAVYYRKDIWESKGYVPPADWDAFIALADRMEKEDHFRSPIAFGNRDQWPALMTFDVLNMRLNGPDFHTNLLAGYVKWHHQGVREVFEYWQKLIRFYPLNWSQLKYSEATDLLLDGRAGMYFIGGFILSEIASKDDRDKLGVFPFPMITERFRVDCIDAPVDGYVLPEKACPGRRNAALKLIRHLATPEAFAIYNERNPGFVGIIKPGGKYEYHCPVQAESAELLRRTKHQFHGMEREMAKPEFVQHVVKPQFEHFLRSPGDLDRVLSSLQKGYEKYFEPERRTPEPILDPSSLMNDGDDGTGP